jgi:signal transduction histidine kinase/ligand-binding sensor domain-containing protein
MPRECERRSVVTVLPCAVAALFLSGSAALGLNSSIPLHTYSRQTWRTDNGLPQNTVHAITQAHDGFVWFGTEGGLVRFDGITLLTFDSQNTPQLRSNNVRAIVEDGAGKLWIATADGLTTYSAGVFQSLTQRDGLPSNDILGVSLGPDGGVQINTSEGDSEYKSGTLRVLKTASKASREAGVLCRFRDRAGVLWTGTDHGLTREVNGKTEAFPAGDLLASATILCVFEDREGNVWVGTDGEGVTILREPKFAAFTAKDGLPSDRVRCVLEDRRGILWVGTDAGLAWLEGQHVSTVTTREGLSSNVILSLAEDRNCNLLAGTPDGLNVFDGRAVRVITSADGLPDDLVRSIYTDADGSLWIGTRRGLSHYSDGRFTTYTQRDGLGSDLVGAITRDKSGSLWVGTYQGLSRFGGTKFVNYSEANGLSGNIVTAIWQDHSGGLWVGTQDGGLNHIESEKIFRFSPRAGLPSVIYGIVEDVHGGLWLTSKTGIYRTSVEDLSAFAKKGGRDLAVAQYGTFDGLPVTECSDGGHPGVFKRRDGSLWFALRKGLASTHPDNTSSAAQMRLPVVIESISVDDHALSPAAAHEIEPGHSRIAFEYTGLSFASPHSVRFKYKLEGFDRDWINAGSRRVAYYTNIPPAKYRFRVLARTNESDWGESGTDFAFTLRPHFYQTFWFDLLLFAACSLVAWQVYRWRVRQVKARYDAVLAERNRIAREIHDTLAQGFVGISLQLELISQALSTSKETAQRLVAQAQASVQRGLAEARRSIWDLRSQETANDDLAAKLSRVAAQVNSTTNVKANLQVFGTRRPLPSKVEDELVKIGQEAIANAVRHANAKHVNVDLSFDSRKLVLAVTDDGRGFSPESNGSGSDGHYGLRGMRERAEQIKADLKVESAPGRGTSILVETELQ